MPQPPDISGLSNDQVLQSRAESGPNILIAKRPNLWLETAKQVALDPMVIILTLAALIYFILGQTGDGFFLLAAIVFVASISLFQSTRSRHALEKLKAFSQPLCRVVREGSAQLIPTDQVVVGDVVMVAEGGMVPADAAIVQSNDLNVNESILTGESMPVSKNPSHADAFIYSGTTVSTGMAVGRVTAVGNATRLGRIGLALEGIGEQKTPLEIQIANFVKKMAIAGAAVFLLVWLLNYVRSQDALASLLQALTLAMSILPEEIPVAFTTFMALGAWRLMKMGIVVKQMKTVEALGSATVICTDKTGTITKNQMTLAGLYDAQCDQVFEPAGNLSASARELLTAAMWASEPVPFDPMEIALHDAYVKTVAADARREFKMVHEYPLEGRPPMMTHVFANSQGKRIIAAKGSPEAIYAACALSRDKVNAVESSAGSMAASGYRILGVAVSDFDGGQYPGTQRELPFRFLGLVAFYDPPKENIARVINDFYTAGISVKIITGDNGTTTGAIARQIGFRDFDKSISGEELMKLDDADLSRCVRERAIFFRMFPEAKLRIINALKAGGEVVAMTGDGVNDGPALKAAHIGVAMGKKGTEIARQAASLVLLQDDLSMMVHAIAAGRKIYSNLKKAIRYIISIHIPIIMAVFVPLLAGWKFPNIFSPVHVIFLELIMGPTCSIIYENEPIEKNAMSRKPRPMTDTFFNWRELTVSIVQGLAITVGVLAAYLYSVQNGFDENLTRTMTFTTLVAANIFLTLENRSFTDSLLMTARGGNRLVPLIIGVTLALLALTLYFAPARRFFDFEPLDAMQLALCFGAGLVSVLWIEVVKALRRTRTLMKQ